MPSDLEAYAEARGLAFDPDREVRAVTPLLLAGGGGGLALSGRRAAAASGRLPGGLEGFVAHHVVDSAAGSQRELTVVVSRVPESLGFVRALSCRSREVEVVRSYTRHEHVGRWRELELESERFNRMYALEMVEGQREAWVRQLFSPSFIDRLASEAVAGFCFELNEGHLCVAEPRRVTEPAELDALCEAAADVAARVRAESLEDVGAAGEEYAAERDYEAKLRSRVSRVAWEAPPASVQEAIRPYVLRAGVGWRGFARAIVGAGVGAGIGFGAVALLFSGEAATGALGIGAAVVLAALVFALGLWSAASQRASRLGLEAFALEYARSRGFELEDRYAFHARLAEVPLPGRADHAMRGRLPSGTECTLAFCADAAEMFSHGEQVAIMASRPLASDVVVAERPGGGEGEIGDLPGDLKAERTGSTLVVWRPLAGNMARTASGTDEFLAAADQVVAA